MRTRVYYSEELDDFMVVYNDLTGAVIMENSYMYARVNQLSCKFLLRAYEYLGNL